MATLEDLKAANATEDAATALAIEEAAVAEAAGLDVDDVDLSAPEDGVVAEDIEEELDEDGNPIPKADTPTWMQEGDEAPDTGTMPVSAHVKTKHKFQGRLAEKDGEIERLKAENLRLQQGGGQQKAAPTQMPQMPVQAQDDFDGSKYRADMAQWAQGVVQTAGKVAVQQVQQTTTSQATVNAFQSEVDNHYDRVATLAEESGITPETYQAAETALMQGIESVRPGEGQLIAHQLAVNLGEGSEKAFYYLGRNAGVREKFLAALRADSSGIRAATMLGQITARIATPQKIKSKTPPPAKQAKGEEATVPGKTALKQYRAAQKAGNVQASFDTKRKAKASGVDVSNW